MADIHLTAGNDTYIQPAANANDWNTVFGEDGNDTIRMFQGTAYGAAGNDRFEKIVDPSNANRTFDVAYWSAGENLRVNLAEGWAEDGLGGRDTLIGVRGVHGSGARNAWVQGDAQDNYYWPNGGDDTYLGGAGRDGVSINSWFTPVAGQPGRQPLLSDVDIRVSADGRNAVFTPKVGTGFTITVTDVEYFDIATTTGENQNWVQLQVADFIAPQAMAEEAIAAGNSFRWNASQALGAAVNVTFSFVTSSTQSGFRAFSPAEQTLVRDILAKTAQFTLITFSEVPESGSNVGQLRFGVSQQASTKGLATLPGQNGDQAGDVWMDVESMAGITPGSEGYQALLHEIGHALGLRHPRNVDSGDAWTMQLRAQDDRPSQSVMSQVPSSDGLFRSDWGPLDVLALRYLYGSRQQNSSDTVYTLGTRESASMTTLIDDGGTDTLDASNSATGVSLDLTPGRSSSAGVTPTGVSGVENLGITATAVIERAVGSPFDDVLLGNDRDNRLTGGLGNDWIEGGTGTDTATFSGKRSDYALSNDFGKLFVRALDGLGGFDTLIGIEQLTFSDLSVTLAASPLSEDSRFSVDEDARLSASLPDPSDVSRSSVSYRLVGNGAHGSATLSATGELSYQPQADFWGSDTITYEVVANAGGSANRYVSSVQVLPVNDGAPESRLGAYLAAGSNLLKGRLPAATDVDGDALSYAVATNSRNGDVVVNSDGSFTYQARAAFLGADSFSFIVSDGVGGSNVYDVTVLVNSVVGVREGTDRADNLAAQTSADGYFAYAGNDRLTGGGGNDVLDGGDDIDTAIYSGARSAYQLIPMTYGWAINSSADGNDRIANIERLQFRDTSVALDLNGHAGDVAELVRALYGPAHLSNKVYIGQGLQQMDAGQTYAQLAAAMMASETFAQLAGGRSSTAIVNHLYRNVVGVLPGAQDRDTFVSLLDSGVFTPGSLAVLAGQYPLNANAVELVGLANTGIEFTPQGV